MSQWLRYPFAYAHAWVSAHFAVEARTFATHGILGLGGVPVVDNPPVPNAHEAYVRWPPLFPWLLSFIYRLRGCGETVTHAAMIVLSALNAAMFAAVVRRYFGSIAMLSGICAFLTSGVLLAFGQLAWNYHLGMFFALAAVYFYDLALEGKWRPAQKLGIAAMFLAIASSWEPLFVALGLLGATVATGRRDQRILAWKYVAAGVAAVALILAFYLFQYPGQFKMLVQQILVRAGISTQLAQTVSHEEVVRPSPAQFLSTLFSRSLGLLGWAPVAGVASLAIYCSVRIRKRIIDGPVLFFAAFGTLWLGWILCFHSHYYIHADMMTLLGLPVAAGGFGWVVSRLLNAAGKRWARPVWVMPVLVIVCIPAALLTNIKGRLRGDVVERIRMSDPSYARNAALNPRIRLGQEIHRVTPPGSVVLTPEPDLVVLYYSERHLVQGVRGDLDLAAALDTAVTGWPAAPVYLALRPEERSAFEKTFASAHFISENGDAWIAALDRNDRRAGR
jgi:hypothetical protein